MSDKYKIGASMKTIVASLLGVLALAYVAQAAPAGDIQKLSGTVSIVRDGKRLTPHAGDPLETQDLIQTGADGSIGISFMDGTRLSLGPSSEARLDSYLFAPLEAQYSFGMRLLRGTAAYASGKLGKLAPSAVRIDTPQATIGIRGTRFVMKVE